MRIAHVTDYYLPRLGGIEMHVSDLAARQAARGDEVTVITSSPSGRRGSAAPADGGEAGPTILRLTDDFLIPHASHPMGLRAGAEAVRSGDYDVVHVHAGTWTPLSFWVALAAARAGVPVIVTIHSLWAWAHPIFLVLDRVLGFSTRGIRWTAVSAVAAQQVQRVVGGGGPVSVLPNGIDPERWSVEPSPREPDDVLVVAVMRLSRRKRPKPLLKMLRAAREQVPSSTRIRAVIVGDGPSREAMHRYLRRHGMSDWVSLPGREPRDQIRDLYRRADVFIAPADLESFGIAALEAHCAGVPVLAKSGNGIADFVLDGTDGLLCKDDADMTAGLVRLCSQPLLRRALAGHGDPRTPVSWTSTLELTYAAYREAAVMAGRPLDVVEAAS
jgi:glycosyltransferase involved in cell wall biosynthesis